MRKYQAISAFILVLAIFISGMLSPAQAPVPDAAGATLEQQVEVYAPPVTRSFEAPKYHSHNLNDGDGYDASKKTYSNPVQKSEANKNLKPRNI